MGVGGEGSVVALCDGDISLYYHLLSFQIEPGRIAQSVGHLTSKSEVLGSIPGLAKYFRFSSR